jgi:C-terminal domain of 1-Cys peroxiredoxin
MVSRREPRHHRHPADGRTTRSSACYRQLVMGIVFNKLETTVEQTHVRYLATVNHRRPSRPAARPAMQRLAVTDLSLGAPRFPQRPADPCDSARARGQHRTRHDLPAPRTHGELRRRGRPDSRGAALQLNESGPFATPADWRPGDRAIISLDIPTDAAKELFPDLDVVKPYLRYTSSTSI